MIAYLKPSYSHQVIYISEQLFRVLLSTGKLVGEGFDHPALDTLVLAMPISWRGNLQQYAGRLHREHALKTNVQIIDFIDAVFFKVVVTIDRFKRPVFLTL